MRLKKPTSRGLRMLRWASFVVGMTVFILLASIIYSAYADYRGVTSTFSSGGHAVTATRTLQGVTETIKLNATVPNSGLYPVRV